MDKQLSFVAIGAGPSGLSLSALATSVSDISSVVLEQNEQISWHSGLMLDDVKMQSSALKDLVTPVDPTNPYSFLSYLKSKRRLYPALVNGLSEISRIEFEDYLRWASITLPNLHFDEKVLEVSCDNDQLVIHTNKAKYRTQSLVLSVGKSPFVPDIVKNHIGKSVFHSKDFSFNRMACHGKCVTVIGGGQSSAEIVLSLLTDKTCVPKSINWISRRANLFMLEDSPFINEWFHPGYQNWFQTLNTVRQEQMLASQRMASDGISEKTLYQLYDHLYQRKVQNKKSLNILLSSNVQGFKEYNQGYLLTIKHDDPGTTHQIESDVVILATGYRNAFPTFINSLRSRLDIITSGVDEEIVVNQDFATHVKGTKNCRVFVNNGSRSQHGIADPNLALLAMRNAKIINAIMGSNTYDIGLEKGIISWSPYLST